MSEKWEWWQIQFYLFTKFIFWKWHFFPVLPSKFSFNCRRWFIRWWFLIQFTNIWNWRSSILFHDLYFDCVHKPTQNYRRPSHVSSSASRGHQTQTGLKTFMKVHFKFLTFNDSFSNDSFWKTFEIRGWRLRIWKFFLDHLNKFYKQWKVRTIFVNKMFFLTYSWRFLRSYIIFLEQLEFKMEKIVRV